MDIATNSPEGVFSLRLSIRHACLSCACGEFPGSFFDCAFDREQRLGNSSMTGCKSSMTLMSALRAFLLLEENGSDDDFER